MQTQSRALAGTAILSAFLAMSVAPTQGAAKRVKPDCPKETLCLWADANYEGQRVVVRGPRISNKLFRQMNDAASSAFLNRKDRVAQLFVDGGGKSASYCLSPQNSRRSKNLPPSFNDQLSSTWLRKSVPPECSL